MSSEPESQKFFGPDTEDWRELKPDVSHVEPAEAQRLLGMAKAAREELKAFLLSSLQMQHLVVFAGSGTSLGATVKGPSMSSLWNHCVPDQSVAADQNDDRKSQATAAITEVGYKLESEPENIEALLSRCEAYIQIRDSTGVASFIKNSKETILKECSAFLDPNDEAQLSAHRTFLHRLSRRRVRDSRLKLFTTNYDLCFETAAGRQGLVALDGFSFSQPRTFDPRFFQYDIVRRPSAGDEVGTPLEGVFHLYKLHGSVDWSRTGNGEVQIVTEPGPESACLIYPAKGKYQQSYVQPHLELISQYLSALRQPNTCLIVVGFGFNDDHLAEPILAAARTNPHLRLVIVNPRASQLTSTQPAINKYWEFLFGLARQGEDVWLINATFEEFADMIPDLKSLTPAQRLTRDIKQVAGKQ